MGAVQRDCQSMVDNLFEKLFSWREESHRQFSDIICSNRGIISEGINDLVKEVNELEGKLIVISKERKVLLETVDNLNGEIKKLNTKVYTL